MEIKPKVQLKAKGETANLPLADQMIAKLNWKTSVDLDLMVFGEKTDGTHFGVYSNLISGDKATMGDANAFPFMVLSEDAGVGAQGGDNEEEIKIFNLENIKTCSIVAFNYTDATRKNQNASFAQYKSKVTIEAIKGTEITPFEIPLDSTEKGHAAIIATITKTPMGASVKKEDKVVMASNLASVLPGAAALFN